jgi:hypothetical protein
LIHLLTQKAVPFFISKCCHQAYGFDGVNQENRQWINMEKEAKKIAKTDIQSAEEGCYNVQSQLDLSCWYHVDAISIHCDCESFPLISFCKHIAAVQNHFTEDCTVVPFNATATPTMMPPSGFAAPLHSQQPSLAAPLHSQQPVPDNGASSIDGCVHLARINQKILDIASHAQGHGDEINQLMHTFLGLKTSLDHAQGSQPLPKIIQTTPNQHLWPETTAMMAAVVKTKRKTHTDPYSGGERSGKKAKPDAQNAVPRRVNNI